MNRTQVEISLGILLILATSLIVLFWGLQEESRMTAFAQSQQARSIEVGAELFEAYCSRCHGNQGLGIQGLCPPLNDRYFFDQRLADVGWSGSVEDYIVATASGGRLASTRPEMYPGESGPGSPAMPAFSDQFGGPLREDQIRNIAAFIVNWEETAQAVQPPPTPSGPVVGNDITKELPEGDAASGEELSNTLACVACHVSGTTGPAWAPSGGQPGIGERAETRYTQPDYTGSATSAEQYLFESIVDPGVFLVEGYADLMPHTYATSLTDQQVADLIAHLQTFR